MTYAECLKIRAENLHLIGKTVDFEEKKCLVKDIVILPRKETKVFLTLYKKFKLNEAENRFMSRTDLEVMLFCKKLGGRGDIIIPL